MEGTSSPPRMDCAVDAAMSVIEGRWKTVILCKLFNQGPLRFSQMAKEIDGISPRILTKQLREMESDGIIIRRSYPEIPPRVEYSITPRGQSLGPVLLMLAQWGRENMFSTRVVFDMPDSGAAGQPPVAEDIRVPTKALGIVYNPDK
jgi:DNA-binding HxlR family transcriptional regulator